MIKQEQVLAISSNKVNFQNIIKYNSNEGKLFIKELSNIITIQRPECETNEKYKQIICYGFITNKDNIYLMQRTNQTETRLNNNYSIGVGGHANYANFRSISQILEFNMNRELNEELFIDNYTILPYGFLNDNSNEVGKVHVGIIYQIHCSFDIKVKEVDKMIGKWIKISEIQNYDNMENWSKILYNDLRK